MYWVFDEQEDDLEFYKTLLKNYVNKKLVCTNPDLVVHRGNVEEFVQVQSLKFLSLSVEMLFIMENLIKKFTKKLF